MNDCSSTAAHVVHYLVWNGLSNGLLLDRHNRISSPNARSSLMGSMKVVFLPCVINTFADAGCKVCDGHRGGVVATCRWAIPMTRRCASSPCTRRPRWAKKVDGSSSLSPWILGPMRAWTRISNMRWRFVLHKHLHGSVSHRGDATSGPSDDACDRPVAAARTCAVVGPVPRV